MRKRETINKHVRQIRAEMQAAPVEALLFKTKKLIKEEIANHADLQKMILLTSGMVQWVLMEADVIRRDNEHVTTAQKLQAMDTVLRAARLHDKIVTNAILFARTQGLEAPPLPPKNQIASFADEPDKPEPAVAPAPAPVMKNPILGG